MGINGGSTAVFDRAVCVGYASTYCTILVRLHILFNDRDENYMLLLTIIKRK